MSMTEITYLIAFAISTVCASFFYKRTKRREKELVNSIEECMNLKSQNHEMKKDIRILVAENSFKKPEVEHRWKFTFEQEKQAYYGSAATHNVFSKIGDGISCQIQQPKT